MAYLDYEGLKRYDTKIKRHIDSQISSASEALTDVILDTHATHTIGISGSDWYDGGGFPNGLNRVLEYEVEETYTYNKHWVCYPKVDFIVDDLHDGDIVLLIVDDGEDLCSIPRSYLDYLSGYYLSTHATFNNTNNEVIELLGTPPSVPGTYTYVLSQGRLRYVENRAFSHMDAYTFYSNPCITMIDIDTDLAKDTYGYISGAGIEYDHDGLKSFVGIAVADGSPEATVKVAEGGAESKLTPWSLFMTQEDLVNQMTLEASSISFKDDSNNSANYGYSVRLSQRGLELANDIYGSSVTGTGFFFEYSSSEAYLDSKGFFMSNYGSGDIDPRICLHHDGSWTQEINMWAQDEECYISLSHTDGRDGSSHGSTLIKPAAITIEPDTGSSLPSVYLAPNYIQTAAIRTYTSSTPNKNSMGTGDVGTVLRSNGSGSSYWGGLNYLSPANNTIASSFYPIVFTSGTTTSATTSQIYKSTAVGVQPSTGTISATHLAVETFKGAWKFKPAAERFRLVVSNYKSGTSTFNPQYLYQKGSGSSSGLKNGYYYFDSQDDAYGIWKVNYGTANSNGLFSGNTYSDYVIIGWNQARYYCHNFIGYDVTIGGNAQTVYRDLGFDFGSNSNGQYYIGLLGNALSLNSSSNYRTAVQLIKMADIVVS